MAKKINRIAKVQLVGGSAKPDAKLAAIGINMGEFVKKFNDATQKRKGDVVPTVITAYADRSFDFELKMSPATQLILRAANLKKGSTKPGEESAGTIKTKDLEKIAQEKMSDLNTTSLKAAVKIMAGSARSIGIEVEDSSEVNNG